MQAALGYDYSVEDTDPEEDLDDTPLWLRGGDTIEDELEDALIKKLPFQVHPFKRGQTRGKASFFSKKVASTVEITGKYKNILKLKGKHMANKGIMEKYGKFLTPTRYSRLLRALV